MSRTVLPSSVQYPHIVAFDLLATQRFDALEVEALLVYLIDSVHEDALYHLAKQLDLLGYNGWKLADTDEKKRNLIKKAIELHRYKGTVWAIKEALRSVGFPNANITEHVTHWAGFTVQLNTGEIPITSEQIAEALDMVRAYKNERSHLMGFEFEFTEEDDLFITDSSFEAPGQEIIDAVFAGGNFLYNGEEYYNGTKNYSSDSDVLELTIT